MNPKVHRRKIREDKWNKDQKDNKKKISETKSWFFEEINKICKLLADSLRRIEGSIE